MNLLICKGEEQGIRDGKQKKGSKEIKEPMVVHTYRERKKRKGKEGEGEKKGSQCLPDLETLGAKSLDEWTP